MATRWCTMEDVQADLKRATGQQARTPLLHEGCLLHGQRPPPLHIADEECEEEHQLRYGASSVEPNPHQPAPDLGGITSMIRMIISQRRNGGRSTKTSPTNQYRVLDQTFAQQYKTTSIDNVDDSYITVCENHGDGHSTQHLTKSDEMIVISKPTTETSKRESTREPAVSAWRGFNPNVEEFVPKKFRPRESEPETVTVNTADEPKTIEDKVTGHGQRRSEESIADEHRIEREELAAMLQNKIRASPDGPRLRGERYAAIAGLIRLHSASSPSPVLTLRTPDYFRNHRSELSHTDLDSDMTTADTYIPDHREVRDSISKVSAWLHSAPSSPAPPQPPPPPQPAPRQPQLAPPRYRRRQDVGAEASSSPSPSRSPSVAPSVVRYVPSANVLTMSERYAARVASAPTPPPSLWDRVMDDLRTMDARTAAEEGS